MTLPPPVYDLVLLLDQSAEDDARAAIVADVEQIISSEGGEQLRHDPWGARALAYPINHRAEAEYHLFQFHGPPALLKRLDHTLRITDGVTRFRVIKLKPGTPAAPDLRTARPAAAESAPTGAPAAAPAAPAAAEVAAVEPVAVVVVEEPAADEAVAAVVLVEE